MNSRNKVLITGATGFVGRALVTELLIQQANIVVGVREFSTKLPKEVKQQVVGDLLENTNWLDTIRDIDVIVHAAARVHVMNDNVLDPLAEFRMVNVDGTVNLARQAMKSGVKRFVFISSIKVNGEMTKPGQPFTANDNINVTDPYGLSKYEAEQALLALTKDSEMDIVIVRPPLIYGRDVKANFQAMIRWVAKGIPLPLALANNKRSFIAIDNMVDFIICCINHPNVKNEVFLVSDGQDISIAELLQKIARALNKKSRLFPVPICFMTILMKAIGKGDVSDRLFGYLQVDSSKAEKVLGWKPVITMDEQLRKMVG